MVYKFNPFIGNLDNGPDLASESTTSVPLTAFFDCLVGSVLGDTVVLSTSVANQVDTLTSNVYPGLAIGIILAKPTSVICEVQLIGVLTDITGGFSIGLPVFIGPTGVLTTTKPTTGSIQVMGTSISTTKVVLIPSSNKVTLL